MFDRFTDRAKKVMSFARQEAMKFNHEYIGTEHILLGLVQEGSGVAANVLKNMTIDLDKIRHEVEKIVKTGPSMVTMGQLPFTPRAKKVLELSMEEASQLAHNYIGTEHLLLGLIRENEGIAAQVLMNLGVKLDEVREEVLEFLGASENSGEEESENSESMGNGGGGGGNGGNQPNGGSGATPTNSKSKTPALDSFGRDLTELAREGNKLDPVIGRDAEIERVIQILSRRTKNNPVLLGEAGVGKTAIVCRPLEQKRLIVTPLVVTGSPARSAIWRAMLLPVAPSGVAQPISTSSTSAPSMPARSTAAATAAAPSVAPCVMLKAPFQLLASGVRAVETITAWVMVRKLLQ